MAALATIIYNQATIQAAYSQSINGAFAQLRAESGITPQVLSAAQSADGIAGGSRDLSASNPVTGIFSDHYESNARGYAAFDLNNQRAFRNWNEGRFLQILAGYGWFNIDISGNPFPSEPWHFANHGNTRPAGLGVTLIDETTGEDDMMIFWDCVADSADGKFKNGTTYAQATPVSPVVFYGDPSTKTAMSQQYPNYSSVTNTRISGNDLSRLAGYYNVSGGPVTVVGVTEERARQIAQDEDNKLRIGK